MAFFEGVANSYADLLAALKAALLANGWVEQNGVLHADGCWVQLAAVGTTLTLRGGAGVSSGSLVQPGPGVVRIGADGPHMQMSFPVTYHISMHSNPREVYLHVRYDVDTWQWLAFGRSALELPASGVWYASSFGANSPTTIELSPDRGAASTTNNTLTSTGLFWGSGPEAGSGSAGYIHTGLGVEPWANSDRNPNVTQSRGAHIAWALTGLIDRQPSLLNGAAVLLPCAIWQAREENTTSLVADLAHCRTLRIDNYVPGEIIELSHERWRVYPFFRKNVAQRDGGRFASGAGSTSHSGTMGVAVRYDGP